MPVSYAIEGDPDGVPAGVAVCAYRIVQEALSNVVRHCGAVAARVELRVSDSALDVAVENVRLAVRCCRRRMAGEGLAGMRERVAVFNGRLETGPLSDGGSPCMRCCRWGSGDDPVLLADDQQLVRAGFRVLLSAEPDLEVVGEAGDVQAVAEARRLRPTSS